MGTVWKLWKLWQKLETKFSEFVNIKISLKLYNHKYTNSTHKIRTRNLRSFSTANYNCATKVICKNHATKASNLFFFINFFRCHFVFSTNSLIFSDKTFFCNAVLCSSHVNLWPDKAKHPTRHRIVFEQCSCIKTKWKVFDWAARFVAAIRGWKMKHDTDASKHFDVVIK